MTERVTTAQNDIGFYESLDDGECLRIHPHAGQKAVLRATERFVFALAGTQGGKSVIGPWWLYREMTRCGAGDYMAITSTYRLFSRKMLPELLRVFEHMLGIGRYWGSESILEIKNLETGEFEAKRSYDPMWARIILGAASSPGGLEAATVNAAWLDECGQNEFGVDSWEAVLRRVSTTQGRILATTTPYNLGWLKSRIVDQVGTDPDLKVVNWASSLNPAFPESEMRRAERTMPRWKYEMFYLGLMSAPGSSIYGGYYEKAVIAPFPIPDHWPVYLGVDYGGIHNVTLWITQDPGSKTYYVFACQLKGNRTTHQHVTEALEFLGNRPYAAGWGGAPSEGQSRDDWGQEGLRVSDPPVRGVEPQIDRVIEFLRSGRLKVFSNQEDLLGEFRTYSREVDPSGDPTEEIADKSSYHRLDALRYVVAGLTKGGSGFDPGEMNDPMENPWGLAV